MSLCQICGTARAERSCPLCGATVCPDHFDDEAGVCAACTDAGGRDVGPGADGTR